MNTRFSALLIASLAGALFAGSATAAPHFPDGEWLAANEVRDDSREQRREAQKARKQPDPKAARRGDGAQREQGYGYGYERRNLPPEHDSRQQR